MSYADKVFINMCRDIIENGTSTEGEKVRPKWEDGTAAYTIKKFGVVNRYDLSKEFPALTLRRTAIKSCVDELLWIWQKKSNNVHELKSHIWDSWADGKTEDLQSFHFVSFTALVCLLHIIYSSRLNTIMWHCISGAALPPQFLNI